MEFWVQMAERIASLCKLFIPRALTFLKDKIMLFLVGFVLFGGLFAFRRNVFLKNRFQVRRTEKPGFLLWGQVGHQQLLYGPECKTTYAYTVFFSFHNLQRSKSVVCGRNSQKSPILKIGSLLFAHVTFLCKLFRHCFSQHTMNKLFCIF